MKESLESLQKILDECAEIKAENEELREKIKRLNLRLKYSVTDWTKYKQALEKL